MHHSLSFMLKHCSCHFAVEKSIKMKQNKYIFKTSSVIFLPLKRFPRGFKENLREEDNLSTRDNWPVPNVSFLRRFYCRESSHCSKGVYKKVDFHRSFMRLKSQVQGTVSLQSHMTTKNVNTISHCSDKSMG